MFQYLIKLDSYKQKCTEICNAKFCKNHFKQQTIISSYIYINYTTSNFNKMAWNNLEIKNFQGVSIYLLYSSNLICLLMSIWSLRSLLTCKQRYFTDCIKLISELSTYNFKEKDTSRLKLFWLKTFCDWVYL